MAWSAAFAPAADQRHYRYNTTGFAQVTPLTAPSHRIPLIPALPRTYIRITGDRVLPPALQDRMIAEADVPAPTNPSMCTASTPATSPRSPGPPASPTSSSPSAA